MPTLKKCIGLSTFINEINNGEGSLDVADNVVIDADNTIESRRGFKEFGNSFSTANERLKQQFVYKNRVLRHYDDVLQFDSTGQGAFSSFTGSYNELEAGLRIKGIETSGNFYFTTTDGIKKISASSPSQFTTVTDYITNAGAVKAVDVTASLNFEVGGFLPPQSKVAYRILWGYKDANNLLILGSPSSRFVLTNTSKNILTPEKFTLLFTSNTVTTYDGTVANRYITFNSKNIGYFIWFSSTGFPNRPNDSGTIGKVEIKVDIQGLITSDAIAAATANRLAALAPEFEVLLSGSTITGTSLEEGEDIVDAASSSALTTVTTTVLDQGAISEGLSANATLSFIIPNEIQTTTYFYQIYRTALTEATVDQTTDDIDPGDEMNLVLEANLTPADIIAGSITTEDITTEAFRASGAYLYTNPNTGEGILSANERPPIAKDLALFRNSVFFANTKTTHKLQLNLLSVLDFVSGTSKLTIGNSSIATEYTFVGETEVTDITTDTFANTAADSVILINSASNERMYYIWFDKGGGADPLVTERLGVHVDISAAITAADVATTLATTIDTLSDFSATAVGSTVTITWAKNGNVANTVFGSPAPGGAWAITVTTQGDGEDAALNDVLLSSLVSVGQAIDETARSLVNIINQDASSPVNVFYLSGPDDLPGLMLFESRNLVDDPFFIVVNDVIISDNFSPELPANETLSTISIANPTVITSTAHGLATGNTIYLYGTDSTPGLFGQYTVTVTGANTFTVPVNVTTAGTTGLWFKTDVVSDNEESPNRIYYSKTSQPESVPILNYIDVGSKDQEIRRILPLRDNLFVLKDDGVYIITGTTAPNFAARLLDSSTTVNAADTAVVLNNKIYALSTDGVVTISESGVQIISRPIENKILGITNTRYQYKTVCFGVAYDSDKSYFLWMPTLTTDVVGTQCYRFNTFTETWTRWTLAATCGIVNGSEDKMYLGSGTSNYSFQERKEGDRTDFADIEFTRTIVPNGVEGLSIQLSTTTNVVPGDVIFQTQYVTINQIRRLLLKLDIDDGLNDTDYISLLPLPGAALSNALDAINAKLVIDDTSGTVTARSFSTNLITMQDQYNDLIAELNNPACDTFFTNYKESEGTNPVEAIVLSKLSDKVFVPYELEWIEAQVTVYKGIDTSVVYSPIDFGATETLKQVREGTLIFDQNNFYSGTLSYASDRSKNFESIDFTRVGSGYWGGNIWGDGTWGGEGNEIPVRTLIPREKQRCRFLRVKFDHINAREIFRVLGISLEPRALSQRAYK